MRKRTTPETTPTPNPCGHPLVTMGETTEHACLWGRDSRTALPLDLIDTPEFEATRKARREHLKWEQWERGLRCVVREEILGPTGEPWGEWMAQ